jgi:hypothetical protein
VCDVPAIPHIPDSPIARAAIIYALTTEPVPVFNHSVRSYLFAELLAAAEGFDPGIDYDSETLFLACVLHDLGLGSAASGATRFEVESADLAASLLSSHGCSSALVDTVWEAIALHSSAGIAERRGPICRLVRGGIGIDFGRGTEFLDDATAASIHHSYPRLSMVSSFVDAVIAHAATSPEAAPAYSMPGDLLRERTAEGTTTMEQAAINSRWTC